MLEDSFVQHVFERLATDGWEDGLAGLMRESEALDDADLRGTRQSTIAWIAIERGHFEQAQRVLDRLQPSTQASIATHACQILLALRTGRLGLAAELLAQVETDFGQLESAARTVFNHLRGTLCYQQKRLDEALQIVVAEVRGIPPKSFLAARLFDSLGMLFAAKIHFFAAREFFEKSLRLKGQLGDSAGQALTHGNLGRLYFESAMMNQARDHFNRDLNLANSAGDIFGTAVAHNWLGRIEIEIANWDEARRHLRSAFQMAEQMDNQRLKAFALKDLALATCYCGDAGVALTQLDQARSEFSTWGFQPGRAFCDAVEGVIQRGRKKYAASLDLLDAAAKQFCGLNFWTEGAKAWRERAHALRESGAAIELVVDDLKNAVSLAERARCDYLLRQVEDDLRQADPLQHLQTVYRRVRGCNVEEDTVSLVTGRRELTSVLFLDLAGSTEYGQSVDPEVVMLEFNQMMSGFADVLERHKAVISGYRGDGFMCIFRNHDHAYRSVAAALELVELMESFNLPRHLLDKPPYAIRIGIGTGEVFNGNVGTYAKMDFTSIGSAANLAARLQAQAEPGRPCICSTTQNLVQGRFEFLSKGPRAVTAKGFGGAEVMVWDVAGPSAK